MELPAPELSLEEELKACLAKKSNAYIFKDLPRLALRTTVFSKSSKPGASDLRSSGPRLFLEEDREEEEGSRGLDLPPGAALERSQEFSQEASDEADVEKQLESGVVSLRLSDMLDVEVLRNSRESHFAAEPVIRLQDSADNEDEHSVDELLDIVLKSCHSATAQERIRHARKIFDDAMVLSEHDLALLTDSDWADLKSQGIPLGLKNKLCKLIALRKEARSPVGANDESASATAVAEESAVVEEESTAMEEVGKGEKTSSSVASAVAPRKGRERSRSNPQDVSHETITMLDGTQMRMAKKNKNGQRTAVLKKSRAPKLRQEALVNVASLMPDEEKAGFVQLCEIERVITSIAKVLEAPPLYYRILAEFNDLKQENHVEMEMLLDQVFTNTIGLESRTTFLLKAIQQGLVMSATYHLKYHVTKELMTRDVLGREGWQVVINISDSVITVTHMRREQALASAGLENYFWFEWHLTMTFDRQTCRNLHSCSLRIVDLWLSKTMQPMMKEMLTRRFCAGKLRIC